MKKISLVVAISIFMLLMQNCKKESNTSNPQIIQAGYDNKAAMKTENDGNTILGKKKKNPYTLANMKEAFRALGLNSQADQLSPNRIYVKLKPDNHLQVYDFLNEENEKRFIAEYPIDAEVVSEGSFYVDDEAKDTILKPYYCVAFSKSDLPIVNYEIIEYGYVPSDEEENVELKAWELAGYTETDDNGEIAYKTNSNKFYPSGTLQVQEAPNNNYPACRHKSVVATTLFKWSYMRTDANGKFNSSVKFLVPALFYIRYWNQEYRIYGHNLNDYLGRVKKSNIGATWQINTNRKAAWHKANINNTVHDYNDFVNTIPTHRVNNAQIWMPWGTPLSSNAAATIMMHYFGFQPHEISPADLSAPYHDFGVYTWDNLDYNWHRELLFHEFSHWTHAIIAGRAYWKDVAKGEGQNISNTLVPKSRSDYGDPYRDGQEPSKPVAQKFGFTEAWAEAMGSVISDYYGITNHNSTSSSIENVFPKAVPHSYKDAAFHLDSWYPVGLFWDLHDVDNENFQATVSLSSTKDCFTLPLPYMYSKLIGAQSVADYKANILSSTPEADQNCLKKLFEAYGY